MHKYHATMIDLQQIPKARPCADVSMRKALSFLGQQCTQIKEAQYQALGFWMRPTHLNQLANYLKKRRPLGRIWHMAPANVDLMFMYPVVLSLLAGNENAVRISTRTYNTLMPLFDLLNHQPFNAYLAPIKQALTIFTCDYDASCLKQLAQSSAMRFCWGSQASIQAIRSTWPMQGIDLAFGHKHALALIKSAAVTHTQLPTLIERFVRDSFTFSQQACTSPKTVIWLGQVAEIQQIQPLFWQGVKTYLTQKASHLKTSSMRRLASLQQLAVQAETKTPIIWNETLARVPIQCLDAQQESIHQGEGLFFEMQIQHLDELCHQLQPWHQTLTFFGLPRNTLVSWAQTKAVWGLDRIEEMGQALVFSHIWDGLSLLELMSRQIRSPQPEKTNQSIPEII